MTADPADADDAELLSLGVMAIADDVVAAFEFVEKMTVVVVGLACAFIDTMAGVVGSAVVMSAAVAVATNGDDGTAASKRIRVLEWGIIIRCVRRI